MPFILFLFLSVAQGTTIRVLADQWCPYNCDPKDSKKLGFMVEILKAALEPKGYTISYSTMGWAEAIKIAREGIAADAIVGASHADAADFVFPSTPQGVNSTCFFTKEKKEWKFKNEISLEQVKVGLIKDYGFDDPVYKSFLQKNKNNPKRVHFVSGDNALVESISLLETGVVDTFLDNFFVVSAFLKSRPGKEKIRNAGCLKDEDLFIAFSPKFPQAKETALLLSKETQNLRRSGALSALLAKYGLSDW